ncbi:hypothetical protein BKA70DRAFT_1230387 [Coprinopsis sp. MPI-PUGE-AT-0042]|nr:hypothetical protein BKA70DRAFT_1230387 [Coprinopsis sp. MPI-PUGE-AT-0042]
MGPTFLVLFMFFGIVSIGGHPGTIPESDHHVKSVAQKSYAQRAASNEIGVKGVEIKVSGGAGLAMVWAACGMMMVAFVRAISHIRLNVEDAVERSLWVELAVGWCQSGNDRQRRI